MKNKKESATMANTPSMQNGTVPNAPKSNPAAVKAPTKAEMSEASEGGKEIDYAPARATDKDMRIPLSQIRADFAWNMRGNLRAEAEDENSIRVGVLDVARSMRASKQDTRILVRDNSNKEKDGKPYMVVYGHRRFLALQHIAAEKGSLAADPTWSWEKPTIEAVYRSPMSDLEARLANARENVTRDDVGGPDLAAAAWELKSVHNMKQKDIEAVLGTSQGYLSQLLTIAGKAKPALFKAWRESPDPIPYLHMAAVAKNPPQDQEDAYKERVAKQANVKRGPKAQATPEEKAKAWMQSVKDTAAANGAFLAELQAAGLGIDIDTASFLGVADIMGGAPGDLNATQSKQAAKAAGDAFVLRMKEISEAAAASEEAPKAPKRAPKKTDDAAPAKKAKKGSKAA